ncbi:MAG TPA: SUF system Fe-S cluster assembly regulator [Xanthomonadaceae bacterium]|nr:SUF system Fe-S cluster assembly regulator [Xanthomonadaceae bacterium]
MLRVSKLTDYATVVMTCLGSRPEEVLSAADVAEQVRLELPTVSKLLKQLAGAGLLDSFRGARGGYRLARPPEAISVAEIVEAMEGPIAMTECGVHSGLCDHEGHCNVRGNWQLISRAVETALRGVSVAELREPPPERRIPLSLAS